MSTDAAVTLSTPALTDAGLSPERLLEALDKPIPSVRTPLLYRLALLVVALVMVALPIVYLGLIALIGYGVYLHTVNDTFILSGARGRGAIWLLAAYLAPIVAGIVAIVFMVKPFFAPRARPDESLTVTRDEEPLLFAFVERLCRTVGAPMPRHIAVDCQVNASAGFSRGMMSFLGNDLTLTIGMPLVAGLDLRQLTGVLAHEFGHFGQGAAMRLTYVIRSISAWFYRVVFERDAWDQTLENLSRQQSHFAFTIILGATRGMVWCSRKVLQGLMWVGHLVSCFMLRQMEFDADRYEARVAGSECFRSTALRLPVLSIAHRHAMEGLGHSFRSGVLGDDLPRLVTSHDRRLPPEICEKIQDEVLERKTAAFDTHPSDRDRIESAMREAADGVFRHEVPARALFADFRGLCRRATSAFYEQSVGESLAHARIVETNELLRGLDADVEGAKAIRRILGHDVDSTAPIWLAPETLREGPSAPPGEVPPHDANAAKAIDDAIEACNRHRAALYNALSAEVLDAASLKFDASSFDLTAAETASLGATVAARKRALSMAERRVWDAMQPGALRLERALGRMRGPTDGSEPNHESRIAEARGLLECLDALRTAHDLVADIRHEFRTIRFVLHILESNDETKDLADHARSRIAGLPDALERIAAPMGKAPYPFDHAGDPTSLAAFIVGTPKMAREIGEVLESTERAIGRYGDTYARTLGRLAVLASTASDGPNEEPATA